MIEARSLGKTFGEKEAVRNLNLDVGEGEMFVLLGPNGAGKTTTLKLLTTLLKPTYGHASVAGFDVFESPDEVKRRIGYVPDTPALYERLTGREFLHFIADIRGTKERASIDRSLTLFEMDENADKLIETYSHGMKKKIALSAALLHQPQVLFLDEPTGGLDPYSARLMKDLLTRLCSQGVAVFMTTHIMEIAEQLCERVGILYEADLMACGTLEELRAEHGDLSLEDIFMKVTGADASLMEVDLWEKTE
ncbi:MAG: ABC transporter ATP-binding protein [Candidatus Poribacteria bacterium]|nr:ABC transporter ATP-binding protein [Candidatus Poribacteria bacterium]